MIFNSPHNPTGKVFTIEEIEEISKVLEEFPDIQVISDEVYDVFTFDGRKHNLFATVGDNYKKTVSIFTSEKFLNITGWSIGWAIGNPGIIRKGAIINNSVYYAFNTPA